MGACLRGRRGGRTRGPCCAGRRGIRGAPDPRGRHDEAPLRAGLREHPRGAARGGSRAPDGRDSDERLRGGRRRLPRKARPEVHGRLGGAAGPAVGRADAAGLVAACARGKNVAAATLAVRVVPNRIAAEGALASPHAAPGNSFGEVPLQRDEGEQGQDDPDERKHERPEVERIEVVRQVVRRHHEREDDRVSDERDADRVVPRALPSQPCEQPVPEEQVRDHPEEPEGERQQLAVVGAAGLDLGDVPLGVVCRRLSACNVGPRFHHVLPRPRVPLPRAVVRRAEPRRLGPMRFERGAVRLAPQLEVVSGIRSGDLSPGELSLCGSELIDGSLLGGGSPVREIGR